MGLLPCPGPCHCHCSTTNHSESQSRSQSHDRTRGHLQSESSSGSISSQSSLPSVPSLTETPPDHEGCRPSAEVNYHCVATLSAHSSYISSLALAGKFFLSGSSDGEIRAWSCDSSGWSEAPGNSVDDDNVVAAKGGSAVKSMKAHGDTLFSAHQDGKVRVWRLDHSRRNGDTVCPLYKFVTSLPTFADSFSTLFLRRNYVEVRRHTRRTWVHHVDAVSSLALSKDGSLLYTASWDRTFKVWRTSNLRCLESANEAHDDAINAIMVSSGGFVYTGSADKRIKVWKRIFDGGNKGRHVAVATLERHKSAVNALALSEDGEVLYSGASDRSILVWQRDGGGDGGGMAVVGALRGHSKAILSLAVVMELVVSGSADKTVRVWRRGADKVYTCLGVLEGHTKPVKCVVVREVRGVEDGCGHGHGRGGCRYWVCSGGLDCNIKVWHIWAPSLIL